MNDQKILYKDECYAIQGAIFEVYREMGCGFLEAVYQECLAIEFGLRSIPSKSQIQLPLSYKDRPLTQRYIPDFICYEQVILELKNGSHAKVGSMTAGWEHFADWKRINSEGEQGRSPRRLSQDHWQEPSVPRCKQRRRCFGKDQTQPRASGRMSYLLDSL